MRSERIERLLSLCMCSECVWTHLMPVSSQVRKLAAPASLETEIRVWSTLRGYCKLARSAMGGARTADLKEASRERRTAPRRAMALELRAEKKRLLSELERRLEMAEARSRKAGKVVRGGLVAA